MNNNFVYSVDGAVTTGGAHTCIIYIPGLVFRYLCVHESDASGILS